MDNILLILCSCLNSFVITAILFQFMDSRYKKVFKKNIYVWIETVIVLCIIVVNLLNNFLLNLIVWFGIVGITVYFLYYEDKDKPLRRVLECEALMFCMTVCESLGVIFLRWILQAVNVSNINVIMLHCLESTFPTIIIIFFYYMIISRLMKKSSMPYSKMQYMIYFILLGYSFINMLVIIEIFAQGQINYLCAINMGCIVLADLYLLYFVKMADEKNYYENQVKVLEQQANSH